MAYLSRRPPIPNELSGHLWYAPATYWRDRRRGVTRKLDVKGIQDILYLASQELGFRVNATILRHTRATWLHRHGGFDVLNIKYMLGHANLSSTQIYTDVSGEDVEKALRGKPSRDPYRYGVET